ncbi:MAG: glucose-1-phosphate cytidylyltransferase [Nitrospinaceae bacterium]
MKAVILAGGLGTRISEETALKPKPMVEVGGKPILWHIMKIYTSHGINDFIICLGYKGYVIKEYFANYFLHTSDVTFDMVRNKMKVHQNSSEPWTVTLVDTGTETQTGGRVKRVKDYIGDETFCLTYGDGIGKMDISGAIAFHKKSGKLATLTGVLPPGRFGVLKLEGDLVTTFMEKPFGEGGWVNGGFFVLEPGVIDLIDGDDTIWEREPMQRLVAKKEVAVFKHHDFWHGIDTLRDKNVVDKLWASGKAPWKTW